MHVCRSALCDVRKGSGRCHPNQPMLLWVCLLPKMLSVPISIGFSQVYYKQRAKCVGQPINQNWKQVYTCRQRELRHSWVCHTQAALHAENKYNLEPLTRKLVTSHSCQCVHLSGVKQVSLSNDTKTVSTFTEGHPARRLSWARQSQTENHSALSVRRRWNLLAVDWHNLILARFTHRATRHRLSGFISARSPPVRPAEQSGVKWQSSDVVKRT